jgi:hypothetical protein
MKTKTYWEGQGVLVLKKKKVIVPIDGIKGIVSDETKLKW